MLFQVGTGKCLTSDSPKGIKNKPWFVVFASFHWTDTPIMANFKLPNWCYWITVLRGKKCTVGYHEPLWVDSNTPVVVPFSAEQTWTWKSIGSREFVHKTKDFKLFAVEYEIEALLCKGLEHPGICYPQEWSPGNNPLWIQRANYIAFVWVYSLGDLEE